MSSLVLPSRAADAQPVQELHSLPAHLRCSKCERAVFNAYQTPHGCRLCERCVNQLPTTEKQRCPGQSEACTDEEEEIYINQGSCFPDIATRRELLRLEVRCPNSRAGCTTKTRWDRLDEHLAACSFEQLPCPKCGQLVVKKKLEEHEQKECPRRMVQCGQCRRQVEHRELESEHRDLRSAACCEKLTAPCPFNCGQQELSRTSFVAHKSSCPKKPTRCKYQHLGCQVLLPVAELPQHYSQDVDAHVEMLDRQLQQLGAAQWQLTQLSSPPAATPSVSYAAAPSVSYAATPSVSYAATPSVSDAAVSGPSDRDLKEFARRLQSVFEVFKKLQLGAAGWAQTTMDLEELQESVGGASAMGSLLKAAAEARTSSDDRAGGERSDELAQLQRRLNDVEFRLLNLHVTCYDGVLSWKVPRLGDSRQSAPPVSPPFFCRRFGHMLRVRLFPNGCGQAEGSHLSASLYVARSEYDDVLDWPFVADVTFRLVNVRSRRDDAVAKAQLHSGDRRPAGPDDASVSCTELRLAPLAHVAGSFARDGFLHLEVSVQPLPHAAASR